MAFPQKICKFDVDNQGQIILVPEGGMIMKGVHLICLQHEDKPVLMFVFAYLFPIL